METLIAVISGFAFGGLCSFAKYLLLWRPIAKGTREAKSTTVYPALMISLLADAVILLVVFLLRNFWPYSFVATIIAAAIGMSCGSILPALSGVQEQKKQDLFR